VRWDSSLDESGRPLYTHRAYRHAAQDSAQGPSVLGAHRCCRRRPLLVAEHVAGPAVDFVRDGPEVLGRVDAEVRAFREVVAQQSCRMSSGLAAAATTAGPRTAGWAGDGRGSACRNVWHVGTLWKRSLPASPLPKPGQDGRQRALDERREGLRRDVFASGSRGLRRNR
jgi:hypothetical protein